MKLEIFKDDLRTAVAQAERLTGKNLSLPALAQLLLEAADRQLKLRATNLDLGIEITLPAKVTEPGQFLISGGALGGFLSNLHQDGKITLASERNNLTVTTTHTKSVFLTYPSDDFPSLPQVSASGFKLPLSQLIGGLKAVSYAASFSDIKPEIASIYLYDDGGDLVLVATDSFRLAEKRVVLDKKLKEVFKLIIPIKNAAEIIRIFDGLSGEVELRATADQLAIQVGGVYLTSRLVDGVFPDYRQIMPTAAATEATVLRSDLVNTLKLVNIFTDKLNQVTIKIKIKDGRFTLSSRNPEVGETETNLEAALEGEDLEASYNVRFILDGLGSISSDSVAISFNQKNRPLRLSGVGDPAFTYLVMPLNR